MDKKLNDLMVRLTTDAISGVAGAQKALLSLTTLPTKPDAFVAWAKENMPAAADISQSKLLGPQLEEWFKLVGFVPRSRYLELLERHEALRVKLEEAEQMKESLQKVIGPQHAAAQLLETFGTTIDATLKAQREFLNRFTGGAGASPEPPGE